MTPSPEGAALRTIRLLLSHKSLDHGISGMSVIYMHVCMVN